MHTIVLDKCGERYVFQFRTEDVTSLYAAIGRMVMDPDLSLSWLDAARISQVVRAVTQREEVKST